ncbi:HTTM domain-containing protein [Isoptericola sp. NPDC055881]
MSDGVIKRGVGTGVDLGKRACDRARSVVTMTVDVFEKWLFVQKRASYGLAVARILLGVMFAGALLTNFGSRHFAFGEGVAWSGQVEFPSSDFAVMWPFSIFHDAGTNPTLLTFLFLLTIALAVLFSLGYRTRLVMIPLFVLWVGYVESNSYLSDQSDNLTRMAMIAIFFAAPADRWSLDSLRRKKFADMTERNVLLRWWRFQRVLPQWATNMSHNLAIAVLVAQICFIYASGGFFKDQGKPWYGGWAVYDPIHVERFGTWPELSHLVTVWGPGVAIATITTVLVQALFPVMLLRRGTRIFALAVIFAFHLGIAVLMGLPWFSLAMIALDAVLIRDVTWQRVPHAFRRSWRVAGGHSPEPDAAEGVVEEPAGATGATSTDTDADGAAEGAEHPDREVEIPDYVTVPAGSTDPAKAV